MKGLGSHVSCMERIMKNHHDCFSKYINQTMRPVVSQDMLMTTARFAISFVPLVLEASRNGPT